MNDLPRPVSQATLTRLPRYLRYLKDKAALGFQTISSPTIAGDLSLNPVQVRKDLASVSKQGGKPKSGFLLSALIKDIEDYLGYDKTENAVLMGAGQLGCALLGYERFTAVGLHIVAAFDVNPEILGKTVNGRKILPLSELAETVAKYHVRIGIITVGKESAQQATDALIAAGIKGIWNFAPQNLILPHGIAVKYEDMAASLAILFQKLSETD